MKATETGARSFTEFREIRRKKEISTEAAEALIRCGRRGILAVNREKGCPYAVSINNLYDGDEKKYFHGARVKRHSCLK